MFDITKLSNWLIFKIGNRFIKKYEKFYKGHLVELGCAEANSKEYFLKFANTYTGVDWENSLHNTKIDVVSDLNKKINLENEYADTIIATSVMEHLKEPEIFLQESYRILKKDSYMILQVPWQWWIHEAPYDYYRYTPYGLKYLFEKAGFEIIEINPAGGFFSMITLKINYFSIRMFKLPKWLWIIWLYCLIPFWTINQLFAPLLDKIFDRDWSLETSGYWVLAKK